MRLVYLSLAWTSGIYLGSRYDLPWTTISILLCTSTLFIIFSHGKRALLWYGLCLILLFGGMLRFQSVPEGDALQHYRGFLELRGVVSADPHVKDYATILRVEAKEVKVEDEWQSVSGTVLINAPKFPALDDSRDFPYYRYGDLLEMSGMLKSPEPTDDEGEFDFADYLMRQGIYSIMHRPAEIELIDTGHKLKPLEWVYSLRRSLSHSLDQTLPEPQCSLTKAMLLGERGSLSPEVREEFSRAGTSHLLAISGVHVSIVAGLALSMGVWLFGKKRPTYFLLAMFVIWLYAVLTGMRPSAIRAATMGSLWLYADWIGRPRSAFTALTFAAAIMLAFNPVLLSDVGFQLSFLAMAGLVFLTPIFQNWCRKIFGNEEGQVSSAVNFVIGSCAVTMGAVLATLPLIAYYFGLISLMSLPATFCTLPAIPGIIVTAALVGITGVFAPALAEVLGWITWLIVTYVLKAVEFFAAMPFASIDIQVKTPEVLAYYAVLVSALWLPRNWRCLRGRIMEVKDRLMAAPAFVARVPFKWIALPLIVVATLMWSAVVTASDNRLHIMVLDIGQGDSILIQKGNQQIIVDGGPSSGKMVDQLGDKLPFWDRTIELLVLTHPDSDHLTGLVEVMQRYKVEKVLTSGQQTDSGIYREWVKLIDEKDVECVNALAGQKFLMKDGVQFTVIHPEETPVEGATTDLNSSSVVLRLEYENFSLLLTGDIGAEAEEFLLSDDSRLSSTVLKVAHHGSNTSSTAEFVAEVEPMFAAISAGADNKFGHPSEEVVDRLEEVVGEGGVYITSKHGAIEFITDGEMLWIKTER